jgi:hypothetical protein
MALVATTRTRFMGSGDGIKFIAERDGFSEDFHDSTGFFEIVSRAVKDVRSSRKFEGDVEDI